jgi:hypothetical protein
MNFKLGFFVESRRLRMRIRSELLLALFLLSFCLSGCGGPVPTEPAAAGGFAVTSKAITTAQSLTVGVEMGSFSPLTSTISGMPPYAYSITSGTLPAGLSLDPVTGAVTGTPVVACATADVVFSVKDSIGVVASTTSTVSFTVSAASVSISAIANAMAQNLTAGNAMTSFLPLTVSGGAIPYTYSVSSGTLPTGLSLDVGNGIVSGTPTAISPVADVGFSVQDANGVVANTNSTVSFTVNAAAASISATANSTAKSLTVGTAMPSFSPLSVSGGATPYTYSIISGAIPTGLSISASTGVVSGTPTASYITADVVFSVLDANNTVASTTSTVSFTASDSISAMASTTAQNLTVGTTMASFSPLTVSGGATPYIYSINSGTLPSGLSFNTGTGAVTGVPIAQSSAANLVFVVQDANGVVANTTSTVSFTVSAAVIPISAIANSTTENLTVGRAMTSLAPLSAGGGTTPYSYSYTGTLPAGLSFSTSTGVVSGTPSATSAATNVVFSVVDAGNVLASTTSTVSFLVSPSVSATANATAQNLTTNRAMASFSPLTASGGTLPYTYSITSGALPTGLSFSASTGVVSGTPTAVFAAANVTFSVKDANNVVAATSSSVSFTVISNITATAITTAQVLYVNLTMNPSFQPLTASGGTAPYTYYVSSGTLPSGLSLSATTGAVSGKPTAASALSSVVFSVRDVNNLVASTSSAVNYTVTALVAASPTGTTYWAANATPVFANAFVWRLVSTTKTTWALAGSGCAGTIFGQTGWILPTSAQITGMTPLTNYFSKNLGATSVWSSTSAAAGKYNGVKLSTASTVTSTTATNATTNAVMCVHQ